MYKRILNLVELTKKKSFFLFGPRSTGKTTLLKHQFPKERIINLLKSSVAIPLSHDPGYLRELINAMPSSDLPIIIDEIQKIPQLLDEVHDLIEENHLRFILTGSSARKLRRGGVNLLAGRAWQAQLFPICFAEMDNFELDRYLMYGGLPQVIGSEEPGEELDAYIETYVTEEIMAESLVQNLVYFSSFLKIAAQSNGQQINFANVSRDSRVPVSSVRAWFQILIDSFTGFFLEPRDSPKRKTVATAKFYFFDIGVAHFLAGKTSISSTTSDYGIAFEHFIAMELRAWLSYQRIKEPLEFWRTRDGLEVDFVIGNRFAIEVKAAKTIHPSDLRGLRGLAMVETFDQRILVSKEEFPRTTSDGIQIMPWRHFLTQLWQSQGDRI